MHLSNDIATTNGYLKQPYSIIIKPPTTPSPPSPLHRDSLQAIWEAYYYGCGTAISHPVYIS